MVKKYNKRLGYKYDSVWEESLVNGCMQGFEYHPEKITYTKPETHHTYTPDFKIVKGKQIIYIECKGRFREPQEYKKYTYIRDSLQTHEQLVFLFMKPQLPMPNAKSRRDGTKRTHAEWAESNGFIWFTEDTIGRIL